jgi:8-oxo-dGTP pyrophosphatase MutT (NUDIX family)
MDKAAVILIVKDGLILGITRSTFKFGIIGGKLDPNENPEQAAIREAYKETGIKIISCVQIYERIEEAEFPDGLDFYTYSFYATQWEGEPKSSDEGEVSWLTKDQLLGPTGAFPDYNTHNLFALKEKFPKVYDSLK